MTFPLGIEWIMYDFYDVDARANTGKDLARPAAARSFPRLFHGDSVFVLSPEDQGVTCISAPHGRIHTYLTELPADVEILDTGRPMWLYTRHKQVSTGIQHQISAPLRVTIADFALAYGIDEAGVEDYIARADEFGYLLEKRTQHRRDTARRDLKEIDAQLAAAGITPDLLARRDDLLALVGRLTTGLVGTVAPETPDVQQSEPASPVDTAAVAPADTVPPVPESQPAAEVSALDQMFAELLAEPNSAMRQETRDSYAMEPDARGFLSRLVKRIRPQHVIEFGSGLSTLTIATAMNSAGASVTTIDHDRVYGDRTRRILALQGLQHRVRSVVAPLVGRKLLGQLLPVYALAPDMLGDALPADLIVIDGPPSALGGRAGVLCQSIGLAHPGTIILLDDTDRESEERAIALAIEWFGDALEVRRLEGFRRGLTAITVRTVPAPDTERGLPDLREFAFADAFAAEPFSMEQTAADAAEAGPGLQRRRQPRAGEQPKPVLFISSNGAGVGHLVRLLAMARRASPEVQPVFFTLSAAVDLVQQEGWPVEHMASREYGNEPAGAWNLALGQRLKRLMEAVNPGAVVFDGTHPYNGLLIARRAFPQTPFIWSRRAMWKPGAVSTALKLADYFNLVLEPGEVATAVDQGPTTTDTGAMRVGPVMFLDAAELLDRAEARARLGLDPDRMAVLVQLGAGNINDTHSLTGVVLEALRAIPDVQICVAVPSIARNDLSLPEDVTRLALFPLSKYAHAFDFGVSASGYNSYHEAIAAALPTIFLPNLATRVDDQPARARFAQDAGMGLCVEHPDSSTLASAVATMSNEQARREMRACCQDLQIQNGARAAMMAVEATMLSLAANDRWN